LWTSTRDILRYGCEYNCGGFFNQLQFGKTVKLVE
jgi:hypothetical protein